MRGPAVTPNHYVAILEANTRISAGNERDVAVVTGESLELSRQPEAMALGDPACSADVLARAIVLATPSSLPRERSESVDALLGNTHTEESPSGPKGVPNSQARDRETIRLSTGAAAATANHRMVVTTSTLPDVVVNGNSASVSAVAASATRTNGRRRWVRAASLPHRSAPGTPANAAVAAIAPTVNAVAPSKIAKSGTRSDAAPIATYPRPQLSTSSAPGGWHRSPPGLDGPAETYSTLQN